jgi:hypothetical protein
MMDEEVLPLGLGFAASSSELNLHALARSEVFPGV